MIFWPVNHLWHQGLLYLTSKNRCDENIAQKHLGFENKAGRFGNILVFE